MKRSDVKELHFITPISNVPSILSRGLLCHRQAAKVAHVSIANGDVQSRRKDKSIPGTGKRLHDYANLYFDAHNPMLCKRKSENDTICVLRIDPTVLDLQDVIVTDRNAARNCRFRPVAAGLAALDNEQLFSRYWTHPDDPIKEYEHKGIKCAEVLVPELMEVRYIVGAFVANGTAAAAFRACCPLPVEVKSDMFF